MRGDVGDVGAAHVLVEIVHSILQVSRVHLISFGRLVGPELAGLLRAHLIVLERLLALNERAETALAELFTQKLASMRRVKVLLFSHTFDLLDLLEPLELQTSVPLHGVGHLLRQVGLETGSECARDASQQAVVRVERFKRLRVVLNRVVVQVGDAEFVARLIILEKTVVLPADRVE